MLLLKKNQAHGFSKKYPKAFKKKTQKIAGFCKGNFTFYADSVDRIHTYSLYSPCQRSSEIQCKTVAREPVIIRVYIEKLPPLNCPSLWYQASTEPQKGSLVNTPLNFIVP